MSDSNFIIILIFEIKLSITSNRIVSYMSPSDKTVCEINLVTQGGG